MHNTKIEWADTTINPIVGCSKGCKYCYARRLNDRFSWVKDFSKPEFFRSRIDEIANIKPDRNLVRNRGDKGWKVKHLDLPLRVFVCSIGDIMDDLCKNTWVKEIAQAMEYNRSVEFMLLTKQPQNYEKFKFSNNVLLGVTIEDRMFMSRAELMPAHKRQFVSIEPMQSSFHKVDFSQFEQVIIGAQTGYRPFVPHVSWVESVKHNNIWYKWNLNYNKTAQ